MLAANLDFKEERFSKWVQIFEKMFLTCTTSSK